MRASSFETIDTTTKQFSRSSYVYIYIRLCVTVLEDNIVLIIKPDRYRLNGENKFVVQIQHLNIIWTYRWDKHNNM